MVFSLIPLIEWCIIPPMSPKAQAPKVRHVGYALRISPLFRGRHFEGCARLLSPLRLIYQANGHKRKENP
jgi:hypothetical protein